MITIKYLGYKKLIALPTYPRGHTSLWRNRISIFHATLITCLTQGPLSEFTAAVAPPEPKKFGVVTQSFESFQKDLSTPRIRNSLIP